MEVHPQSILSLSKLCVLAHVCCSYISYYPCTRIIHTSFLVPDMVFCFVCHISSSLQTTISTTTAFGPFLAKYYSSVIYQYEFTYSIPIPFLCHCKVRWSMVDGRWSACVCVFFSAYEAYSILDYYDKIFITWPNNIP